MRPNGSEIYRRIFERADQERSKPGADGTGSPREELRRAIAMAVRELRTAMEKDGNPAVTMAHMRNLDDVAPMALARAYAMAERNCVYWPSPGEIREFAGASENQEASAALDWMLEYLDTYGTGGRRHGPAVTFAVDATGRREMVVAKPAPEAPAIPQAIERTLALLGNGSAKHGLKQMSQHPRLRGWEEVNGDPPGRAAERIERQWARCYRQAMRETAQ